MFSRRDFLKIGGVSLTTLGLGGGLVSCARPEAESKLTDMTAGVEPLTMRDFEKRQEKAGRLMAEHNLDGLLLTGSTDLRYFTSVEWGRSERTFGAVLNRKREPVWVCPAFEEERAKERIPDGQEIRTWHEHENPFKLIAEIMRDLGAAHGRLATGPTVRNFVLYGLKQQAPGLELLNGAVITESCRACKTEKELGYMDLAAKITKIAYRDTFDRLSRGMSTGDVRLLIQQAHERMGAVGRGGPSFGPNSAFPHGSKVVRDLQDGDIVLVDGGCDIEGFRSDVSRTVVFGHPSDRQREVWDIVRKAQVAAHEAIRPGVSCEDIDRAARKVIEDAGFGPDYAYFSHRLGHGIGMDGHEYPYLVRGNKLKLEPGMTFSNEPGIYIYGEFGVRVEDCFVVTEDGARILGGMESTAIDQPFGE